MGTSSMAAALARAREAPKAPVRRSGRGRIAKEQAMEMHPMLRGFFGEG